MEKSDNSNAVIPISLESLAVLKRTNTDVAVELKGNASQGYNIFFHAKQTSYVLAMVKPSKTGKSLRIFRKVDSAVKVIVDELKCQTFQMTIE
jgi:hypothetical protein